MSLVKLAQQKKLPDYQYMDNETLNWIIENNPKFNSKNKYRMNIDKIEDFKKYIPPKNWFLDLKKQETIHGVRHLLRITIYADILRVESKGEIKKQNLIISAMLHDIQRLNDKDDYGHGERSAKWFLDNIIEIEKCFKAVFNDSDKKEIYYAIYYHNLPYKIISSENNYKKHKNIVDIIKTSDALDRYSQPKLKWWIDDKYLVLIPPDEIKEFAYNLVAQSEKLYLAGLSNVESVFEAIKLL